MLPITLKCPIFIFFLDTGLPTLIQMILDKKDGTEFCMAGSWPFGQGTGKLQTQVFGLDITNEGYPVRVDQGTQPCLNS